MAYKSSARGTRPVRLIAVHTAEGARTARSLGAYFNRDDVQASSHVGIDGAETLQYVPYSRAAWTLRSGNPISDNAELCGFARWTRQQWLSDGVVDKVTNPRAMLRRCSAWIAERCKARGIDVRKLTVVQLAKGEWGVIAHDDWTKAMKDGSHWDPGPGFPWDVVIADARALATNTEEDIDMADLARVEAIVTENQRRITDTKNIVTENQRRIDATDDKVVAALQPTLQGMTKVLQELTAAINSLPRQTAGGGVSIDYAALAKAVNDDAAKRMVN